MGGSTNVSSRYFGNSKFQEYNLNIADKIRLLHIFEKEDKVSIGIGYSEDNYYKFINEFDANFKIDKLVDLKRINYNGDRELCCLNDIKYYWKKDGNIIKDPNTDGVLFTCNPSSSSLGKEEYCDSIMENECINFKNLSSDMKCKVWFNNIIYRKELFEDISNKMFDNCKDNINKPYCHDWLNSVRILNDEALNSLADTVIKSQKEKHLFKCAFPPNYIVKEELNILTPKECWYKDCVDSGNWKLLTENIYKRNQCNIYECNINILDLINLSDKSQIKIICQNKTFVDNNNEMKNILDSESRYNMFLVTKYDIFILFMIILLFFIFFHNY